MCVKSGSSPPPNVIFFVRRSKMRIGNPRNRRRNYALLFSASWPRFVPFGTGSGVRRRTCPSDRSARVSETAIARFSSRTVGHMSGPAGDGRGRTGTTSTVSLLVVKAKGDSAKVPLAKAHVSHYRREDFFPNAAIVV